MSKTFYSFVHKAHLPQVGFIPVGYPDEDTDIVVCHTIDRDECADMALEVCEDCVETVAEVFDRFPSLAGEVEIETDSGPVMVPRLKDHAWGA
jgi:hypothetical protein